MSEIVDQAKNYVKELLTGQLNGAHWYHNWDHTEYVYKEAKDLAKAASLGDDEKLILVLGALFHDTGFIRSYADHEAHSKDIAKDFLQSHGVDQAKITQVTDAIEATRMPHQATSKLGELLQDADLASLAAEEAPGKSELLRKELAVFENKHFTDIEWVKYNLEFYKQVNYHSPEGKSKYEAGKEKNKEWLKSKNKQNKKEEKSLINGNRTAELLFKTALRNHINLTMIADNKANIMLSINAVILTFALPLVYQQISQLHWSFLVPFSVLGGTSVFSIIYAALATQPGTFKGKFNLADIQAGKGSLFFFGNFFNTPLQEYSSAMKIALASADNLDDSAIIDLYFLGKSIGRKFKLLRNCYSFFLIGITLSTSLFVIVYILQFLK